MEKRKIIRIDNDKCNGCGLCIPNCPEGALQIIDGKVRLVSDLFCDGLGACIGHCPQGAISVEERQAEPYDERKVMANVVKQGKNVVKAHLEHLKHHNQEEYLSQAIGYLREKGQDNPLEEAAHAHHDFKGCPGSRIIDFKQKKTQTDGIPAKIESELRQWPIQLHLVSPQAPYYQNADVLLSADCVAYALGSFHQDYLRGKAIAIACPKLDEGKDIYLEKIRSWMEDAKINTLTVITMQVPCCMGLLNLAKEALGESKRKVPVKHVMVSLQGEILKQEWV